MTQKQLDFIVSFHTRLDRQGPGSDAETFVALDLFQPFLDALEQKVNHPHVRTLQGSMDDLPFEKERFDLVWSEGAIYNMGFEHGV
jgi:ubiquinone/menaquinone biosynthesis C-methylase UbiE